MNELVVLSLGKGSFTEGFPSVFARIGKEDSLWQQEQVVGSLPAAPEIPQFYANWRLVYEMLYCNCYRSPIEIESAGITNVSEAAFQEICQQLEEGLNRWLSCDGFRPIEARLRTRLNPTEAFWIVLESDNDDVWRIPWNLWSFCKHDYRSAEIVLSTSEYPSPIFDRAQKADKKINILVILGDSTGIDIQRDRALLEQLPGVKLKFLVEPKREELNAQLWEQHWDILFFAGHGKSQKNATRGKIYINSQFTNNSLTIEELQEALARSIHQGLQLAIFNCCDGLGLARDWANAKIPLPPVILMREAVPDAIAHKFLQTFLSAFARGTSFHLAVRQAREQLKGLEGQLPGASWLPVICQHPATKPLSWQKLQGDRSVSCTKVTPSWQISSRLIGFSLLSLLGFYGLGGHGAAVWANRVGVRHYRAERLVQAKVLYHLSSFLDPFNPKPHYNLAWLCEKSWDDLDCAAKGYRRAGDRGLDEGSAQLARILMRLRSESPTTVFKTTERCLDSSYPAVRAACLGVRAWLLWEQERPWEAKRDIEEAIALEPDSPHARCLYARILEKEGREEEAREHWRFVQESAKYNIPEQNRCRKDAAQRLFKGGSQK
ncbi:MAG: CHAT domain-containing protein [Spirulina sp.]